MIIPKLNLSNLNDENGLVNPVVTLLTDEDDGDLSSEDIFLSAGRQFSIAMMEIQLPLIVA